MSRQEIYEIRRGKKGILLLDLESSASWAHMWCQSPLHSSPNIPHFISYTANYYLRECDTRYPKKWKVNLRSAHTLNKCVILDGVKRAKCDYRVLFNEFIREICKIDRNTSRTCSPCSNHLMIYACPSKARPESP